MNSSHWIKLGFVVLGIILGLWLFRPSPSQPRAEARPTTLGYPSIKGREEIDPHEGETFEEKVQSMPRQNLPGLLRAKRNQVQDLDGQMSRLDQQIVAYQKPPEYKLSASESWNRGKQAESLTRHKIELSRIRDQLQDEIIIIERFLATNQGNP